MKKFLVVGLNPAIQNTLVVDTLQEDAVHRSLRMVRTAAGKATNVARVLSQLGYDVDCLTWLPESAEHDYSAHLYSNFNLISIPAKARLRTCTSLVSLEKHTSTEIIEPTSKVESGLEEAIWEEYLSRLPFADTVIISGSKAKGFSENLVPGLVREAKEYGKMIILDLSGSDLIASLQYSPDLIMPNFSEFTKSFFPHYDISEHFGITEIKTMVVDKIRSLYSAQKILAVLTRGRFGVMYCDQGVVLSRDVFEVTPLNTIGCGDSFTAGFASVYSGPKYLDQALDCALLCAKKDALTLHPGSIDPDIDILE